MCSATLRRPVFMTPSLDVYLGAPVHLKGANGYEASGQAIFQYGASYYEFYPNNYSAPSKRDFVYGQSDYRINAHIVALGAFKYEDERGSTVSSGGSPTAIERGNYSYTLQLAGDLWNRLYYTIGSGLENNGLFGFAATPRASLAYYLFRPSNSGLLSGTRLNFSFGKGIKEPSIYYQSISLFDTFRRATQWKRTDQAVSRCPHRPGNIADLRWRHRSAALEWSCAHHCDLLSQ